MELEHAFTVPVDVDTAWQILRDIERVVPCMPGATLDSVDGDDFTGRVKVKVGPMQITYKGEASFVEVDDDVHRAVIDARGRETRGSGTANATITAHLAALTEGTRVQLLTNLAVTGKPAQFGRGVMADVGEKLIGMFADCLTEHLSHDPATVEDVTVAGASTEETPVSTKTPNSDTQHREAAAEANDEEGGTELRGGITSGHDDTLGVAEPSEAPAATQTDRTIAGALPEREAATAARPEANEYIDMLSVAGMPVVRRLAPAAAITALLVVLLWWRRRRR